MGCYRTLEEIAEWETLTEEQQSKIIEATEERRVARKKELHQFVKARRNRKS